MSTAHPTQRIRTHLWLLSMIGAALVIASSAPAHEKPSEKEVWAFRTHLRPTIDGLLDDADWKRATPATEFILIEPEEASPRPTKPLYTCSTTPTICTSASI